MITELHTVALYVADQERAKRFYVDQLGFDLEEDAQALGDMGRWIEVAPKGSPTALLLADAAKWGKGDRVGNSADVTLRCDDVRALDADLTANGVPVTEPRTLRFGTFVDVTDPDGHVLRVVGLEGRTIPDREGPA